LDVAASGIIYADKVQIGGVTVSTQAVEAATSVSSSFVSGENDGLVGLGFEEGNACYPNLCYTFMDHAASLMPQPLFTATLRHGKPGEYDFGFIDTTKYTGPLTYVPLTDASGAGYWEFTSGGYSINHGPKIARTMDAIADTGTSLAIVDDAVVTSYYASVPNAHYNATWGGVIFPCANANKLPSLGFWMSGVAHTMPAAYGVYGAISQPAGYCYGGVQSNAGSGLSILGDVWLKSQFVVFNYNKGGSTANIAFAQQAGVPT
jgi:aspergillopepsin I